MLVLRAGDWHLLVRWISPDLGGGLGAGFLLRILWCSQSGDHNENTLVRFGYILNMKIGENQNPFIFLTNGLSGPKRM